MTVSTTELAASIDGNALGLKGGTLTLDATRATHVEAAVTVSTPGHWDSGAWVPDPAILALLDPRETPRVVITADAESYDLGVRDWQIDYESGDVSLMLASDEALLQDYAPLVDDDAPFFLATSLRAVVNYVLGEAIPGAALEATPAHDADITPIWDAANVNINPNAASLTNWLGTGGALTNSGSAGAVGNGFNRMTMSAATSAVWPQASAAGNTAPQVRQGSPVTFSIYARSVTGAPLISLRIVWYDATLGVLRIDATPDVAMTPSGSGWGRHSIRVLTPPPGAVRAAGYARLSGASGNVADFDGAVLAEGRFVPPYFDGATADTATYAYDWTTGVANGSNSTRTALVDGADPESLVWRAGQSAIDFLASLVQTQGLRLVCDGQRNWTLRDEEHEEAGAVSVRYGVNMITGSERITRDSGAWFDARVTRYRYTDALGSQIEKVDAYALTDPYTRATELVIDAPYPGPGRSEYAVRRAQNRGREVTATARALWGTRPEQTASVIVPDTPTLVGRIESVSYDLGPAETRDRMTITMHAADIPTGAVDLLAGTVNALTGTVNAL